MGLFSKKKIMRSYDKDSKRPVIKTSICTGEQVALENMINWEGKGKKS